MRKLLFLIFLFFPIEAWATPSNSMSITPAASDGAVIAASDENTRNNEISTKFNAHDHTDISQTGNTVSLGDGTAGNKTIEANNADGNKPFLRYDDTRNKWLISADGTNISSVVVLSGADQGFYILPQTMTNNQLIKYNSSLDQLEATSEITLSAGTNVNEFSTDGTLAGNSDDAVPTEKAVKTYVDSFVPSFAIGTFSRDTTTASGSQAVTGVGFTPRFVIFNHQAGDGTATNGLGFDDGTTTLTRGLLHGTTSSLEGTTSFSILDREGGAGTKYEGKVSSFDSDGFTISWTKTGSPTGTLTVDFMAFE